MDVWTRAFNFLSKQIDWSLAVWRISPNHGKKSSVHRLETRGEFTQKVTFAYICWISLKLLQEIFQVIWA